LEQDTTDLDLFEWEKREREEHQAAFDEQFDEDRMARIFSEFRRDFEAGLTRAELMRKYALRLGQANRLLTICRRRPVTGTGYKKVSFFRVEKILPGPLQGRKAG
jgi:hypothetical protein